MELQDYPIPKWLNVSFLKKILEEKLNQDVKIHHFTVEPATKSGDNFTTDISRLVVSSSVGVYRLIVKKSFDAENNILKPYNIFAREIRFYTEYLPELYEILKSIDEFEELAPELFYSNVPDELLILKDLRDEGYSTVNRKDRVCREGAELMLKKLAKLHASSLICNLRKNGALEKYDYDVFRIKACFQNVFTNHMEAFLAAVKSWGSEFELMIPKLEYISEHYLELADRAVSAKGPLNVLAHNDLWFNNLLYKNESSKGRPSDVIFIDFQLTAWTSLAVDIIVFFYTSLNEVDYQDNFKDLIKIYHQNFERILKKLNYGPIPTVEDILKEVRNRQFHSKNEEMVDIDINGCFN